MLYTVYAVALQAFSHSGCWGFARGVSVVPYANANGTRLWYEISGHGEPMVLLGGGGLGRHNFDPILPSLARHFTVLSVDQRGYGQSAAVNLGSATVETFADDAVALMNALDWPTAHIQGTSLGGQVALAIGVRHPERARSIVANACFARADFAMRLLFDLMVEYPRSVGRMDHRTAAMVAGLFLSPAFLQSHPEVAEQTLMPRLDFCPLDAWLHGIRAMRDVDLSEGLSSCNVPTLVIGGDRGRIGYALDLEPPGIGLRGIAERLTRGELAILEDSSQLTIVEAPEQHFRHVLAFTSKY